MHAGQCGAEIVSGLGSGGTGVHAFDVKKVPAPLIDLDHAGATLGVRCAKPLKATTFAFEEAVRAECPALAIFPHVVLLGTTLLVIDGSHCVRGLRQPCEIDEKFRHHSLRWCSENRRTHKEGS